MGDAEPVYMANGRPATRGVCSVCGTGLFKIGATPAHEGIPAPASAGSAAKTSGVKSAKAKSAPVTTGRAKGSGRLVIVESPAKARTVGRFLGSGYDVRASIGHVRDLLRSKLSVDVENDFAPTYRVPDEKRDVVKGLKSAAARAREVYLATDPDREGEAIAWHLVEAADIPGEKARRVVFHEITQGAIQEAFSHSRDIDMDLVDAQQARRILDRLVGYQISPLLWDRVKSRLSAGRVQSVALRLIVEREREILAFVPVEYWSIDAELAQQTTRSATPRPSFLARLVKVNGEAADLRNREDTDGILKALEGAQYVVATVKRGERKRRPNPPFTTSTLQQDAAQRLGLPAARTMRLAQDLYEGIDIGHGEQVGLITYMRTDSVNVSREAQAEARAMIAESYGPEYVPAAPNVYRSRAKNAQEAHEAIRPTSVRRLPKALKDVLSRDQLRLYELIWQRFVASQMTSAIYDTMTVEVEAGAPGPSARPYLFRATGSRVRFPGFLVVYFWRCARPGRERGRQRKRQWDRTGRQGEADRIPDGRVERARGAGRAGAAARSERRRGAGPVAPDSGAALHAAAAALHGRLAGEGAGRVRHRQAQHLCRHHLDHHRSRLRDAHGAEARADRARIHRERSAGEALRQYLQCWVHGEHGRAPG
jgi:DNA topoisomerase-1